MFSLQHYCILYISNSKILIFLNIIIFLLNFLVQQPFLPLPVPVTLALPAGQNGGEQPENI